MRLADERLRAHATALRERGVVAAAPAPEIVQSWQRCLDAGMDWRTQPTIEIVTGADLAQRRDRSSFVRRLAQAELETLAQQIAGSNFLLCFADRDGVILDLFADNRFRMSGSDAGIVSGSCWIETAAGTNGLGTALHLGRSVAVTGPEHFFLPLAGVSCTAAPIRDAFGQTVGALDASSYFESRQHHTQALVQMAATHIENALLVHQMRDALVIAVHPRPEFLATLSAGLLAFDEDGQLAAINARGRQLLAGLDASPGARFEDLFGEPFDPLVARLALGREVRLRDTLGSVLVASLVSRSRPRPVPAPIELDAAPRAEAPLEDPAVIEAYRIAGEAARLALPILISGATGTGKELLARHAHAASGRRGAFVAVNCGALPDELFEAELFGYAAGAFTGARRDGSPGLIVSADGGTLLLDEVAELPLPLQAALLRFLDDRQVRPVGGTVARTVNALVLASSNADLDAEVAAHRFRADLLYRLNTVRVTLPPLAQRRDFAAAVRSMLLAIDGAARIDDDAIARLAQHRWPGNFRELRSVLTRALLAAGRQRLTRQHLDSLLPLPGDAAPHSALQASARETVLRELERCAGSISRAARNLGVSRTTVYRHLRAAGHATARGD